MEATPRTLKRVFGSDERLTVPLFQRPYVWKRETHWDPLWEDVLVALDRKRNGNASPHFLGAVVLEQVPGRTGSLPQRQIIDGQQRLTTLQVLIAAARDVTRAAGVSGELVSNLSRHVENRWESGDEPPESRWKLWPTNADRPEFVGVMRGDIAPAERIPDSGITGAYQFFVDAIEEFVEQSVDETDVVLGELAQILLEGLQIVVIDLSPTDNAQVIFETMNARGTPLLASDLIKNLIFRTLHEGGRNAEAAYENYWQRFEAEKWREEISQGRLKRPRIDAFVGHLLTVLTNGEVLSHQLFPEFRRHLARAVDPADGAEQMLRDMARYADVYEAIETWRGASQAETDLLRRLAISETTTVTPVLMWLLANDGWSSRLCALRALDSYLTRRTLCRLTTKNYNRMFLTLLQRMKTVPEPAELVEQYLAEQSSTSGAWPSDLQLERDFEELPLYGFLPRPRLNRILQELERAARSEFSEPIEIKGKTTLEHLMPQAWRDHWPMPDSASEEAASGRDRLVHTIGNLTLLTGPLNSSLSNGPWSDKRADILKHSALSLNRSLPEEWDEDEIRMRSLELADLAARLWPRPVLDSSRPAFIDERERVTRPEAETARPVVRGTRPSTRRNVAVHIAEAFTQVPIGTTMSVGQIAKFESQEYAGAKVSQGAISALIKRGATIPGLRFQTSPVAGATKLGEVAVPAGPDPGRSRSDHAEVRARLSAVGNPGRYLADE